MNIRTIIREELGAVFNPNISDIIRKKAQEYLEGGTCSTFEINNGLCDSFAVDVISEMGGYSDDLYELSDDMIFNMRDPDFVKENWPGELIETPYGIWSKNMLDRYGYPPVSLEKVNGEGSHVWIYYKGKHYDAEAPKGVTNWVDLPLFKRFFGQFK